MAGTVTQTISDANGVKRLQFDWTTDASGVATATTADTFDGAIITALFVPDTSAENITQDFDFSSGFGEMAAWSDGDPGTPTAVWADVPGHSGGNGVISVTRPVGDGVNPSSGASYSPVGRQADAQTEISAWFKCTDYTAPGTVFGFVQVYYTDLTSDFNSVSFVATGGWQQVTVNSDPGNYGKDILELIAYAEFSDVGGGTLLIDDVSLVVSAIPADNYDVTLSDSDTVDALAGQGANLSNAGNVEKVTALGAVAGSALDFAVANAGATKSGTAVFWIR